MSKKGKCYISGRITGVENARELFAEAEKFLTDNGFEVVNPMTLSHNHEKDWVSHMKEDIVELMKCDTIFMLKLWYMSKGAILEYDIARGLGYKILYEK